MTNRLHPIILQKQREVIALKSCLRNQPSHPIHAILQGNIKRHLKKSFKNSLMVNVLSIIAEIKRKSPSKGTLTTIADPMVLANTYVAGEASALSILTDETFFGGTLEDLTQVAIEIKDKPQPILRKDFIIDEIQIAESIEAGADAILCIVAVLGNRLKNILLAAAEMDIDVLVEVHNHQELEIALESGAEIIGVNNRNLNTFALDTDRAFKLLEEIPKEIIRVAESGILIPELAQSYHKAGFNAVLIGEALVKANDPADFMRACRDV